MDNNPQKPGVLTSPTQPSQLQVNQPISPVATQVQPAPSYDWNRYEAPKPTVNRFVESGDTLDNSTVFKTEASVTPPIPPKASAILDMPSHKHFLSHLLMAVGAVILIALGSALATLKNNSNTNNGNIVPNVQSSSADPIQSELNQALLKINRNTQVSGGKTFTASGPVIIQDENNSASAFKIQNAAGNNLFIADTINNRVGIGMVPASSAALQVAGDISTNGRLVAGGGVTIGADGIRFGATLVCSANGCISSSSPAPSPASPTLDVANVALLNGGQIFTGTNKFSGSTTLTNATGTFSGNGAGLTGINADTLNNQAGSYYTNANNLSSGTLSDARLSNNVTLAGNGFNGVNQLVQLDSSGLLPILNGSALTNIDALTLQGNGATYFTNATNISSGTLNDSRLSANDTLAGNSFNGANQLVKNNPSGDLPSLSGINLTSLNASAVASGTLNDLRLSSNVTLQGNTFNGASQLLQLTGTALYPALNGSLITNINASSLASGTVSDLRLSSNVALVGAATQTFTGNNTFSNIV